MISIKINSEYMLKKEWIYREMLYNVFEKKVNSFTQKNLAHVCYTSISNVHKALAPLMEMIAIEKKNFGFSVIDSRKILYYWSSIRRLKKDIVYRTFIDLPVIEIENRMPPCLFTAYSAYRFIFELTPTDYTEVFAYVEERNLQKIKERFPPKKGFANVIILSMDDHLKGFNQIPLAQLFVDLWNIDTWYARDFLIELEGTLHGILE
jgi:hypothetical protein